MLLITCKCLVGSSKRNEILAVVPNVSQSSVSLENESSFSLVEVHINIISIQKSSGMSFPSSHVYFSVKATLTHQICSPLGDVGKCP